MAFLKSRNNADTFVKSINGNVYYVDNTRDAYNADCIKLKEILIREGENSEQNDEVQTNSEQKNAVCHKDIEIYIAKKN